MHPIYIYNQDQVRSFATSLLQPVLGPLSWTGDVFLCGGAFKSLIRPNLRVKDLDLGLL